MLEQSRKRNARAIERGSVNLLLGSVCDLPSSLQGQFDKILTVNSIQFWENSTEVLRELRQLMTPWGKIAVALQPRSQNATNKDTQKAGHDLAERLRAAGFKQIQLEIKPMKPVSVACSVGINDV